MGMLTPWKIHATFIALRFWKTRWARRNKCQLPTFIKSPMSKWHICEIMLEFLKLRGILDQLGNLTRNLLAHFPHKHTRFWEMPALSVDSSYLRSIGALVTKHVFIRLANRPLFDRFITSFTEVSFRQMLMLERSTEPTPRLRGQKCSHEQDGRLFNIIIKDVSTSHH